MGANTVAIDSPVLETPNRGYVSGFWRRIVALIVDWIIVGVPLEVFGWFYFDRLSKIGDWGVLIGIIVALLYFGMLGSSVGGGQTLGMRVCRIKVVDASGSPLTTPRSLLRYAILWIPIALYGAATPGFLSTIVDIALFLMAYFYIFNRRTRQSLHDLAAGSFVVNATVAGQSTSSRIWRPHWAIASACVAVGIVTAALLAPMIEHAGPFPELVALQHQIAATGEVQKVGVQAGVNWTNGQTFHYLAVTAIWKGHPTDYEKAAAEVATVVLRADPSVFQRDVLQITIRTEFNLGLATGNLSHSYSHRPRDWQQLPPAKQIPEAFLRLPRRGSAATAEPLTP